MSMSIKANCIFIRGLWFRIIAVHWWYHKEIEKKFKILPVIDGFNNKEGYEIFIKVFKVLDDNIHHFGMKDSVENCLRRGLIDCNYDLWKGYKDEDNDDQKEMFQTFLATLFDNPKNKPKEEWG